eukprot:TRINITY_DN7307_c0_g3_i1.p2 TRINITY_DN7307_c0_g3~~TRINITY_DN7307_c0_g3_i1.p2  ORF type:complete len:201 (+),score=66.62 TRINITY_DN7307_c0_g3_i1:81-683(+)
MQKALLCLAAVATAAAADSCANVLVTYHSKSSYRWTEKLANEVATGAREYGAPTRLRSVNETTCDDVIWADGIILGSPVYWAMMSTESKAFIEKLQIECFGWPVTQLRNKVGAAFATGGHYSSGKDGTMDGILSAWRQMHMISVGCEKGQCSPFGAAATRADAWVNVTGLAEDEILGGRSLGERVAEIASMTRNKRGCIH